MIQNNLGRWKIQLMRWIGGAILIVGIAGLVFGILVLVAANTVHNEEVEQLEIELSPTTIGELKDLREMIRDNRHDVIAPEDVASFLEDNTGTYIMSDMFNQPSLLDDVDVSKWETWDSMLLQEKGTSLALLTLGTAQIATYTGIGAVILSVGLMLVGLLTIVLGFSIKQIKTSGAEPNKSL